MTDNDDNDDTNDQDPSDQHHNDDSGQDTAAGDEPGSADAPARTRTRTRTRTRRPSDESVATDGDGEGTGEERSGRRRRRRRRTRETPPDEDGRETAASAGGRDGEQAAAGETDAGTAETGEEAAPSGSEGEAETGAARRRVRSGRRRGSRGGRGRRGRAQSQQQTTATSDAAPAVPDTDTTASGAAARAPDTDEAPAVGAPASEPGEAAGAEPEQARRGRKPSGRGQRPLGGISEETRRAITEGPPRRMLVTVGEQRSQVAVLEGRDLAEHYVTDRHDTSYVGNIYMGRVQNVLPGMEAAFVDIGKGRNGVLYAGEVDYDEDSLEGDLPRIEQNLEPGQAVLVQVTKDPMGTKGARLTQHLSIAGRYCVLTQGDGTLGISRKLAEEERDRLREILGEIRPEGHGLIVRTAAEGATQEQLANDIARLTRIWERVDEKRRKVNPLEPVYEEPDLVIRVIRDAFGPEYTDLIVDSPELGKAVRDYLGDVSPELVDRVSVHTGETHLFEDYEVTNQIRRGLEKKVWLASGGYLIIEKTEAMWVVDVNTGKFVGESNLEETVLRVNLEAADEIARQLRLRDMGGIIVIDFVDMLVPANRDEVLKRFKRELARDKTKSRVMQISKLGLVEMTRKNVSQGLQESFTENCETCEGRGAVMVRDIVG